MTSLDHWLAADGTIIALDGSDGVKVLREVAGLDSPPIINTLDQRVGAPGATRASSRRSERPVFLPLVVDLTAKDADEVIQAFQSTPGTLVSSSGREMRNLIYDGGLEGVYNDKVGGVVGLSWRKLSPRLLALDPLWFGTRAEYTGGFDDPTAFNANVAFNANIPFNGGSSADITVTGHEATYPIFLAEGPLDSLTVAVGGSSWKLAVPLLAGEWISVETYPGRRGPHRGASGLVVGVDDGPIDWTLLTKASQLGTLEPGVQRVVFGASGFTVDSSWLMAWEPRWLVP